VYVRSLSPAEVREIDVCRAPLAELAGRLAAASVSEAELAALEALLVELRAAAAAGNLESFFDHTVRIQDELVAATGNATLARVLRTLDTQALRTRYAALSAPDAVQRSLQAHERLLAALRARDAQAAARLTAELVP
jgi:DNA-binding GntR family transcriptional regulator